MKKFFLILFILGLVNGLAAQTVQHITAQTTRMQPQTVLHRFQLKPGDSFSPAAYEKAQDDLHKLRVFKKLEFSETEHNGQIDITINAQDGYYIFPLAFFTGGSKSSAGASGVAGNLFKQAEQIFFFAGGSKDGFTTRKGISIGRHLLTMAYTQLHFDQNFYRGGWSNVYSVFSTTDDDDHRSSLLRSVRARQDKISLLYNYRFSPSGRVFISPVYNRVVYAQNQLDSGNHHALTAGLHFSNDIRPGMNMGALAGYGLTDKQKSLQDLPHARTGYSASLAYSGGGKWSDSDYAISKLAAQGTGILEFPGRHLLIAEVKAQEAFEADFTDQILSTEVLTGAGKYDRQFRGDRAAGAGISFAYYLLRNQTGLLSLAPFYEISYTRVEGSFRPHSGAGANLFYRLWRFPLPFGINYTHNLQDGSHQVGFVIGGAF